ncbi:MAG: 50S ribosomal protein L9 [Candidatus Omnitrophota bacterium]|jgi:large subunit ribosomal protein L9
MEVILEKDVPGAGKAGAVVKVKDGYALNYLIPRGLAVASTDANRNKLQQEIQRRNIQQEKLKQEAEALKEKLANVSLTLPVLVHEGEKLYANVTAQDISRALKDDGFNVEKNLIVLDDPIKALGIYEVMVKLHPEVSTKIKIWIVKK